MDSDLRTAPELKSKSARIHTSVFVSVGAADSCRVGPSIQNLKASAHRKRRFNTFLLGSFAGVGIVLALVGVYGLICYIVSSQTRNIGIRTALGAWPRAFLQP